jgi:hypothetical protein
MRKLIVLLVAGAFLAAFTVPAMAAEWSFFGDSKFHTYWVEESSESLGAPGNIFDDEDLFWGRSAGVAVGASVTAGDIGGYFMLRPIEAGFTMDGDFSLMYGTWNFGAGTLLVGRAMGPVNFFPSNMVFLDEHGMVGLGGVFTYFKPLIALKFSGDYGQIHLAAVEPQTSTRVFPVPGGAQDMQGMVRNPWNSQDWLTEATITGMGDCDTDLPKLEASYGHSFGPVSFSLMGGWQSYEERNTATDKTYDIDSWIVGLGVKTSFGPLYINGVVTTGQNENEYMCEWQQGDDGIRYDAVRDEMIDNETDGFNIVAGVKVNDMLTIEAGYGWLEHELDMHSGYIGPNAMEDDTETIYIQAVITLAKGVTITPEIGKIDWGENNISGNASGTGAWGAAGGDEGDMVYYGAQWRIQF